MTPTTLTIVERQILANQFEILSSLKENEYEKESYSNKATILENGYSGLYSKVFEHIRPEEHASEIIDEIHSILTMYRTINPSIEKLSEAEKLDLDLDKIIFDGFDHNDPHYNQAAFIIEKLGDYKELNGALEDSHTFYSLHRYKKMLPVFNNLRSQRITLLEKTHLQLLIDAVNNGLN